MNRQLIKKPDYSLYLVTDRELCKSDDFIGAVEDSIRGGARIVQLREKSCSSREFFDTAVRLRAITRRHDIPLVINDRLDIALACEADGLHIGQSDLPADVARKLLGPERILGVSASCLEDALAAKQAGADYIGFGAVFPTGTKSDASTADLEILAAIKERLSIPVLAIGGINSANAHIPVKYGADGICVVSAILSSDDVYNASRELLEIVRMNKNTPNTEGGK